MIQIRCQDKKAHITVHTDGFDLEATFDLNTIMKTVVALKLFSGRVRAPFRHTRSLAAAR